MNQMILPKLRKLLLLLIIILSFNIYAQDVLLTETVDTTAFQRKKYGPNGQHFLHPYMTFGFVFGENSSKTKDAKFGSNEWGLGLRYKLGIFNHWATGVEFEYNLTTIYYPSQKPVKKDRYLLSNFKYAWYTRINFGKRGDIIGKFVDVGVWGASTIQSKRYLKTKVEHFDYEYIEETQLGLKYINKFNYGFLARIGINQFVLFFEYRYNDILKEDFVDIYNNIPPYTIGLQIGLHR